jgi:putative ABC transport system permease protein
MWRALIALSWAHTRHHAGRQAVVLLAVALGVALASSVQMINHSALGEFTQAVRATQGEPDVVLVPDGASTLDDAVLALVARDESVVAASAVLELETHARADSAATRWPVRVIGIDALQVATVAPSLWPQTEGAGDGSRWPFLAPRGAWLNAATRARLGHSAGTPSLQLQSSTGWHTLEVHGRIAAAGSPVIVVDIAAAQARFGRAGRLSRIDVRLQPGTDIAAWQAAIALPAGVRWAQADDAVQRVSNLSRAYRVNLGVLALVALLVGGFLVYSVVSLSVAQRTPALALLGVLGLAAARPPHPGAGRKRGGGRRRQRAGPGRWRRAGRAGAAPAGR